MTPHRLLVAGRTGQTAVYDRALDAIDPGANPKQPGVRGPDWHDRHA